MLKRRQKDKNNRKNKESAHTITIYIHFGWQMLITIVFLKRVVCKRQKKQPFCNPLLGYCITTRFTCGG